MAYTCTAFENFLQIFALVASCMPTSSSLELSPNTEGLASLLGALVFLEGSISPYFFPRNVNMLKRGEH